jgi:hypothetical protein
MCHKTYLWQPIPYIKYFRLLQLAIDKIGKLTMQIEEIGARRKESEIL